MHSHHSREIGRIATFLEIEVDPATVPAILAHCSFALAEAQRGDGSPLGGAFREGGASTFIDKGVDGRWRDVLTRRDAAEYEAMAMAELGPDCARWLATGEGASVG